MREQFHFSYFHKKKPNFMIPQSIFEFKCIAHSFVNVQMFFYDTKFVIFFHETVNLKVKELLQFSFFVLKVGASSLVNKPLE